MNAINCTWPEAKSFINRRSPTLSWVISNGSYRISASDGLILIETLIPMSDPASDEQVDFEANYKSKGDIVANQPLASPFAAKTLSNGKKLYKREHGMQATLTAGTNTVLYTIPYAWVKIIGLEIMYGEKLDTIDIMILDSITGTYSTVPNYKLNQFGFNVNVAADEYEEQNAYDADLYYGMQIKIVYNSQSAKTIGINFNLNEVK